MSALSLAWRIPLLFALVALVSVIALVIVAVRKGAAIAALVLHDYEAFDEIEDI